MYHAFTSDSAFKSVPTKGSEPSWQTSMLYSYTVLLIYVNETIYLYGDLPFFKIHVNHFMAWHDSPGAKIISKWILWVRGLVPFWVLRHFLSLISRLLIAFQSQRKAMSQRMAPGPSPTTYIEITLAGESSWAIKWLTWTLKKGRFPGKYIISLT